MADETDTEQPSPPGERALDPFEFQPGVASRIQGLGGGDAGLNPEYAFHTSYIEVAEGAVNFTARFRGLRATYGTLLLRVHRFSQKEGAELVLANMVTIELDRLVRNGSSISIRFEGFQDVIYAFYGGVLGETDAVAEQLTITVDRPVDPSRKRTVAVEARNTSFGNTTLKPTAHITSQSRASLSFPVSQIATRAQLLEPEGTEWVRRFGIVDRPACDQWELAYVAQVLTAYGMIHPGAQALALRRGSAEILAMLAAADVRIVDGSTPPEEMQGSDAEGADAHGAEPVPGPVHEPARTDLCPAERYAANVTHHPAHVTALPPDFVNFDFLWSTVPVIDEEGPVAVSQAIRQAMGCLRPGGLAVHVVALDPSGEDARCFTRQRIDQLVLGLIAGGHEVAQLRIAQETPLACARPGEAGGAPTTRVGIIARRARLAT